MYWYLYLNEKNIVKNIVPFDYWESTLNFWNQFYRSMEGKLFRILGVADLLHYRNNGYKPYRGIIQGILLSFRKL